MNGTAAQSPLTIWFLAIRPRTLPAAIAPVVVGTALAAQLHDKFSVAAFVATAFGALLIQIGTNLANDYSDARLGADTEERLGPVRVTAGGLVPPKQVLRATWGTFAGAFFVGLYLVSISGWPLLIVGVLSILAGFLYTGGPRPYGYEGLGEIFVFIFFGLVSVCGTYYVQTVTLDWEAVAASIPVGLLAAAILIVNNVRDMDTDRKAGKRTLAVRIGRSNTRNFYAVIVLASFPLALLPWVFGSLGPTLMLSWLALPLAAAPIRTVRTNTDGPALNECLAATAKLELAFCALLSVGILI